MINLNLNNKDTIERVVRENFRTILYAYDYLNIMNNRGINFNPLKFNPLTVEELNVNSVMYPMLSRDRNDSNLWVVIRWDAWNGVHVYFTSTQIKVEDIIVCLREGKLRQLLEDGE